MRYRIEFLIETTEEYSVCAALRGYRGLQPTLRMAFANAGVQQVEFGAGGFQIRDMDDHGRVVAIEEFRPMGNA